MRWFCFASVIFLISVGVVAQSTIQVDTVGNIILSGTQPSSGANAPSPLIVSPIAGGNNTSATAGTGSSPSIAAGMGGNGVLPGPAIGGTGGQITMTAGNGGSSTSAASYAPGGGVVISTGSAGATGTGGANGGDVIFNLGSPSGSGRPGTITIPVGDFPTPSLSFAGNPQAGLSFHGSPGYIAYSDVSMGVPGVSCGGWDDQGFRLGHICAIRFAQAGLGTTFNNGCLTTDGSAPTTGGTLSIDNTSMCNTNGHGGNLKLTNLISYGSVTVSPSSAAGMIQLSGSITSPTCATNDFCIFGFSSASATAYGWQPSATAPSGTQVMLASTPSSGVSAVTYENVAGSGAGITSGPTTSTNGDIVTFTGTGGQISDSGNSYATATTATWSCYGSAATTSTLSECQWTLPFGITVVQVDLYFVTAPVGCSTYPVIALYDSTAAASVSGTPITLVASTNSYNVHGLSTAVTSGHVLQFRITTAGSGCGPNAAGGNFTLTYHQ